MTDLSYEVVVNHEGQYSIWDAERVPPPGWHVVGKRGSKDECLAYINKVWTDVTPLSIRQRAERGREP
jgi:MbtH protein